MKKITIVLVTLLMSLALALGVQSCGNDTGLAPTGGVVINGAGK